MCFSAGLVLALTALLGAVLLPATSPSLFERALLETVNADALNLSDAALSAFAREAMRYLRSEKDAWEPSVGFSIPDTFFSHMAEVRAWVAAAPWMLVGGLAVFGLLLWLGGRRRAPCFGGLLAVVAGLACLLVWAALDFDSLWMVLHRALIPGGIFPAGEPVMRLFPLSLFFRYLLPVCLLALGSLTAACGLIFAATCKGRNA